MDDKMELDADDFSVVVVSEKRSASEVFGLYLHENKGKKLGEEDVKKMLKRAFQGCDLVYSNEVQSDNSDTNKLVNNNR